MTRWPWLAFLGLVAASALMAFGPYRELAALSEGFGGTLDELPRRSPAAVDEYLVGIGPEGRALYARHFWWDLGFLAANALFFWGLIAWGFGRAALGGAWNRIGRALPLMAAACDLVENLAVARVLRAWPELDPQWVGLAALATSSKLALGMLSALVAIAAVVLGVRAARTGVTRAGASRAGGAADPGAV